MKRNYPLIRIDGSIHDGEYHENQDYQDGYVKGEKIVHPTYVDKEEDIDNRYAINYLLTALDVLESGKDLSELIYQDFRNLIKEIFIKKGWNISEMANQKNDSWILTTTNL